MLPLRLTVQNFMSYGADCPPLDFGKFDLVVLSGSNGVGKSSLLEAITWALWGQARAASDDELIRLGQTAMSVSFEFEVNGNRYKVLRKRQRKTRGGVTTLEFQGEHNGNYISLSEPTIKATQAKIDHTLRLSYETFVNSAFIRQGHADEFTGKKPAERKAILTEILDLYLYEELAEAARAKVKLFESNADSLALYVEQISAQLQDKAKMEEQAGKLEPEFQQAHVAWQKAQEELVKLQSQRALGESLEQQLARLLRDQKELQSEQVELTQKQAEAQKHLAQSTELLQESPAFEKAFAELQILERKLDLLREKKEKVLALERRRQVVQTAIEQLQHSYELKGQALESQKALLKKQVESSEELSFKLQKVKKTLKELAQTRKELEKAENSISKQQQNLASLETKKQKLAEEGNELKDEMTAAEKLKGNCPTCKQPVTETHRKEVLAAYEKDILAKRAQYQKMLTECKAVQELLQKLEKTAASWRVELKQEQIAQQEAGRLQNSLDEVEKQKLALNGIRNELEKLDLQRKDNPQLRELQMELDKLKKEEKLQAYKETEHLGLEQKLKTYASLHDKRAELERAKSAVELYSQTLRASENRLKTVKTKLEEYAQQSTVLNKQLAGYQSLATQLKTQEAELLKQRSTYEQLQAERESLKQKLSYLSKLEEDLKQKEQAAKSSKKDRALYEELAQAFSKKGIQAMIIESVVPELELEANNILGRMTDNQLQVKFELQRPKKATDGTIETLEIKVADSAGTRDYELFSGGEAFRINFAIRVALSKLLARRAGARLQMLVLDEGFGTLDQIGRDHLIAAINAIKNEFAKIVIITHIDELKDAFPYRIEVMKDGNGSKIEVSSS